MGYTTIIPTAQYTPCQYLGELYTMLKSAARYWSGKGSPVTFDGFMSTKGKAEKIVVVTVGSTK